MKRKSGKEGTECLKPMKADFQLKIAANPMYNTEDVDVVYLESEEESAERSNKRLACYAEKLFILKH